MAFEPRPAVEERPVGLAGRADCPEERAECLPAFFAEGFLGDRDGFFEDMG